MQQLMQGCKVLQVVVPRNHTISLQNDVLFRPSRGILAKSTCQKTLGRGARLGLNSCLQALKKLCQTQHRIHTLHLFKSTGSGTCARTQVFSVARTSTKALPRRLSWRQKSNISSPSILKIPCSCTLALSRRCDITENRVPCTSCTR